MAYLKSDNVRMFPSAFRRNHSQSYLTTESNLTETVVASSDFEDFVKKASDGNLIIVIDGYRFVVAKASIVQKVGEGWTNVWASINIDTTSSPDGEDYKTLVSIDGDHALDVGTGENSEFRGLLLSNEEPVSLHKIKILEKIDGVVDGWDVPNESTWRLKASSITQNDKSIEDEFSTKEFAADVSVSTDELSANKITSSNASIVFDKNLVSDSNATITSNLNGNATTATSVDLSDDGSSDATVKIKVGSGNGYSYTVNNVAHATNAENLDNAPTINGSNDKFTITVGGKTSGERTINNVAHATNAQNLDDTPTIGGTNDSFTITAGGKTSSSRTINNVAHATSSAELDDTPSLSNDGDALKVTAGGKTSAGHTVQYASTTGKLKTARTIAVSGAVTGSASTSFDNDVTIVTSIDTATNSSLGVVKGGSTSGNTYGVSVDGSGAMTVNVPWTDTTYSEGTNIDITGSNYSYTINVVSSPSFAGDVTAQTFTARSDERLKENIESWEPKESILDLPIRQFDFKSDGSHHIGCIAQDLQRICPEIVHEREDGYLAIEESKLVYLLIDEVKKLREEIDELKKGR